MIRIMIFKNSKVYDTLKWIGGVVLPALATLWLGLAKLWGFPYSYEIAGTITLFAAFINALLGISSISYAKANATIEEPVAKKVLNE